MYRVTVIATIGGKQRVSETSWDTLSEAELYLNRQLRLGNVLGDCRGHVALVD